MSEVHFRPEIFSSFFTLERFLEDEEKKDRDIILAKASNPAYIEQARSDKTYFNRWQVAWIIIKVPFDILLGMFFKIVSEVSKFIGCDHFAKTFELLSRYQTKNINLLWYHFAYKEKLLIPCFNCQNPSLKDYYLQEPITKESIEDLEIRGMTSPRGINFFHSKGECQGICNWFLQLYLTTISEFNGDHRSCLMAASEQFIDGASYAAGVLQTLFYTETGHGKVHMDTMTQISFNDFLTHPHAVNNYLDHLDNGAYLIHTETHVLSFIKTSANLTFIFDPNRGLIQVESENINTELMDLIIYYQQKRNLDYEIEFIHVSLKGTSQENEEAI